MANRLKMAKIHAIIGLLEQGWSYRRIARELGVDRETVARYDHLRRNRSNAAISRSGSGQSKGSNPAISTPGSELPRSPNPAIPTAGSLLGDLVFPASNRPLEEWGKLVGDVPTATAILDRFLSRAEIIQITGKSYRLKDKAVATGRPQQRKGHDHREE